MKVAKLVRTSGLRLKLVHFVLIFVTVDVYQHGHAQSHNDAVLLFKDTFGNDFYDTEVRPRRNQSETVYVGVTFDLVAIKDVNDVEQSLSCNGFFGLFWIDEIAAWNASDYGGILLMHPKAKDMWRPRVAIANALGDRDTFKDDHAATVVLANGSVQWYPSNLFVTSCELDMTKYPFDEQSCFIGLVSLGWTTKEVKLYPLQSEVLETYYSPHHQWHLINSIVEAQEAPFSTYQELTMSSISVTFHLKRRPSFLLLNVILPVVFLSLMNLLVFLIPVESGEKISYGITVLLALAVYLSFVSNLLPRSSDKLPRVNIYIFILLIISVVSVADSIVIVFLHHKAEEKTRSLRRKQDFKQAMNQIIKARKVIKGMSTNGEGVVRDSKSDPLRPVSAASSFSGRSSEEDNHCTEREYNPGPNKCKIIARYIDIVSLILFSVVWLSVTLGFIIYITQ